MTIQLQIIKTLQKLIELLTKKLLLLQKEEAEKQGFKAFSEALGKRESGGNYLAVNTLGYLGKWQFGMARLCDLGYTIRIEQGWSHSCFAWKKGYSKKVFLNNPNLQDKIFREHVVSLIKQIKRGIEVCYIVKYTLSGLVAFCHIAGFGGLKKFLRSGVALKDAYGTSGVDYMKRFKRYDLTI